MKFSIIILDENAGYRVITTIGPFDSKDEAQNEAHRWFDEMDNLIPEIAMGYGYEIKAIHSFDTAKARVVAEILIQTRRDPFMRGVEWDGYMGSEYGMI